MRSVLIGAAAAVTMMLAGQARAETDSSWVSRVIADTSSTEVKTEVKVLTRKRNSVVEFSGLARDLEAAPKPRASSGCIPAQLQSVINDLEAKFGSVSVTSTCRGASANRAAGGAPQSLHLIGQAVDFRVSGSSGAVMAFLSANGNVGGLKHYGGGLYHIDTGSRRPF